jgi:hypothetical protein
VLLNWADRLDAVVVATRADIATQLPMALAAESSRCGVALPEVPELADLMRWRTDCAEDLGNRWAHARRLARRRQPFGLPALACALHGTASLVAPGVETEPWQLHLGSAHLPEPALLLHRVLNRENPNRQPQPPSTPLRRAPLCLVYVDEGISTLPR